MTDDDPFDLALDALEAGAPREALAEAARIDDAPLRGYAESLAYLDLKMLEAARGALGRLEEAAGADAPLALRIRGELDLAAWRIEDARSAAEAYADADPEDPWPWVTLALCHDVLGDANSALDAQRRAHALDPEAVPAPFTVTDVEFDAVVEETLAGLPEMFRRALDGVRIVREPTPSHELAEAAPLDTPPDALGFFHGRTIHDEELSGELPATVYLFRRNLERIAADRGELSHEIRITLLHEIGHALGLDEDEVAAMGLA